MWDSDYAYASKPDTSDCESDGDNSDDEESVISSETFSSEANNTYMDYGHNKL